MHRCGWPKFHAAPLGSSGSLVSCFLRFDNCFGTWRPKRCYKVSKSMADCKISSVISCEFSGKKMAVETWHAAYGKRALFRSLLFVLGVGFLRSPDASAARVRSVGCASMDVCQLRQGKTGATSVAEMCSPACAISRWGGRDCCMRQVRREDHAGLISES